MGAEVAVGVAIGSVVAGLVSSAATNSSNRKIAEETNETSTNIAEFNNATQVAMNQANNQFAHDEAELAWQRQVQYNSPIEQVKRYNEAGLNPAIMMSGSAGGSFGQTSPVATPHGSGITPSMPNLIAAELLDPLRGAGVADSLQKVASSMSDISSSKLSDAQKQSLLSKLDSELRGMELQNQWQEVMNAWQPYMNDAQVKLSLESAKLAAAQAIEAKNNGDLLLEKKMTEKTQRSLNKALRGVYGEQRVLLRQQNDTFMDGFRSRLKVESSQSAKNVAEAKTENALRESRLDVLKADARKTNATAVYQEFVNWIDKSIDESTGLVGESRLQELKSKISESKLRQFNESEIDALRQFAIAQERLAAERGDYKSAAYWVDLLREGIGTGFKAAGSVVGVKAALGR